MEQKPWGDGFCTDLRDAADQSLGLARGSSSSTWDTGRGHGAGRVCLTYVKQEALQESYVAEGVMVKDGIQAPAGATWYRAV